MLDDLPHDRVDLDLVVTARIDFNAHEPSYRQLLTPDESERMARFVFERDRQQFLITRALVRTTLSRYARVAPAAWRFIANDHGRPEVLDRPAGVADLRFNLSHTHGLIACAVTVGREVGVDVEDITRDVTHDVAGRFFAPREVADLRSLPSADQERVFFDYWTLKEAYIKARGLGLSLPLSDFAFCLRPPALPTIAFEPTIRDDPASWQFFQTSPTPKHRLGLAVRRSGGDVPIRLREVVPKPELT
ncbi:MAG: 4'-phosphopantetheinyl transferase family protein [Vicinamibacterales bacterium]